MGENRLKIIGGLCMQLTTNGIANRLDWEKQGINLFSFDRDSVTTQTKQSPVWVHFGAGNIFRALPAMVCQRLLESGDMNTGIIVAEGFDYEIIDKVNIPHNNLSVLVTLKSDGNIEKTVVGSVVDSLKLDAGHTDFIRLKEIFASPSLQMTSFTITEKGYKLADSSSDFYPDVKYDIETGYSSPKSYIGKVAALCYHRFITGAHPISLVSMDNCSHNGTMLFNAIHTFAKEWAERGLVDKSFLDYICNPEKVAFPWSMIDKITPRPDTSVQLMLEKSGLENTAPIVTSKNTFVSIFVNAEETEYLVIEDAFPNGRPPLEKGGIILTQKETVDKVEKMKVCTCLNPLHTSISIFGRLLGYKKISECMEDSSLLSLIKQIGYVEGLPVVVDPKILSPKQFIDTVVNIRLTNPFIPDTPERILTDTSQKIPVRFGETIKAYISRSLNVNELEGISITLAGWCRYLLGIDDNGNKFELSPDPLFDDILPLLSDVKLETNYSIADIHKILSPILSNKIIFAIDLYEAGLGETVERHFKKMVKSYGAISEILSQYMKKWESGV